MADRLPTVSQIDRARQPLRQAYEIATMIEGMDGHAPDHIIDRHRQQLQFQFEQIAIRLGYRFEAVSSPRLAVDNSNMREVK